MLFLKSLLFIVWNLALGLALVYFLRWFLFNKRPVYIFKKRCILTPGFIVRKREWLFAKARDLLFDYLKQAEDPRLKDGYLARWEEKIYDFLFAKAEFVESWRFLPAKFKESIRKKIAEAFSSLASKFLRKTVPHFIEAWRIEYRIDDYDFQFSIDFLLKYYNRYVHRYLVYFFLITNAIIGIENMILYLIIG